MGVQLIEESRRRGMPKFVAVGTVCAHPKHMSVAFREETLWNYYSEETNAPYGLAEKMLLVQAQAYRQQYGWSTIFLLPANPYGPGDHVDLETSHVIPALIQKCVDARERRTPGVTSSAGTIRASGGCSGPCGGLPGSWDASRGGSAARPAGRRSGQSLSVATPLPLLLGSAEATSSVALQLTRGPNVLAAGCRRVPANLLRSVRDGICTQLRIRRRVCARPRLRSSSDYPDRTKINPGCLGRRLLEHPKTL
jgi:hypothetical protein